MRAGRGQPCKTTVVAFRLDEKDDPEIHAVMSQVRGWCELWSTASVAEKKLLREVWEKAFPEAMERSKADEERKEQDAGARGGRETRSERKKSGGGGSLWKEVRGPISATQATLINIGWLPVSPGRWLDPTRSLEAELGNREAQDQQIMEYIEGSAKDAM